MKTQSNSSSTLLKLLPESSDYVSGPDDPLRFYYYPFFGKLYRRRVEICLDLLPGGEKVLEVGFGSGVCFTNLAGMYTELYGLDMESDCNGVQRCFAARGITPQLANGSVTSLPYPDNFFDSVLCISIFEHLKPGEQESAHREIRRVLRPGGVLVYGVPVERPLMVMAFRILGYNIREHHFSTEHDVSEAAGKMLAPVDKTVLHGLAGLAGPIYEARSFRKIS